MTSLFSFLPSFRFLFRVLILVAIGKKMMNLFNACMCLETTVKDTTLRDNLNPMFSSDRSSAPRVQASGDNVQTTVQEVQPSAVAVGGMTFSSTMTGNSETRLTADSASQEDDDDHPHTSRTQPPAQMRGSVPRGAYSGWLETSHQFWIDEDGNRGDRCCACNYVLPNIPKCVYIKAGNRYAGQPKRANTVTSWYDTDHVWFVPATPENESQAQRAERLRQPVKLRCVLCGFSISVPACSKRRVA